MILEPVQRLLVPSTNLVVDSESLDSNSINGNTTNKPDYDSEKISLQSTKWSQTESDVLRVNWMGLCQYVLIFCCFSTILLKSVSSTKDSMRWSTYWSSKSTEDSEENRRRRPKLLKFQANAPLPTIDETVSESESHCTVTTSTVTVGKVILLFVVFTGTGLPVLLLPSLLFDYLHNNSPF